MSLELVSAPSGSEKVVTLAEMKTAGRISTSSEDSYIEELIEVAISEAEIYTCRKFITQTWKYYLDYFPDEIELPIGKTQSVTSIKYKDANGAEQTLSRDDYQTNLVKDLAIIKPAPSVLSFPTTQSDRLNAVWIEFVVGYGNSGSVPKQIKLALKTQVAEWYKEREITDRKLMTSVELLLYPFRLKYF